MGWGCSLGSESRIQMKTTKLPAMDDIFREVQKFVDEVYAIRDPLEEDRARLLKETEVAKIPWGNTHHATVGILFALLVTVKNPKIDELFKTSFEPPFIEIDISKSTGKTLACVKALLKYVKTIVDVKDRIDPMIEKAKEFCDTAEGLPDKAKDEANNAVGLGPMEMIMAVKNTAINCKHMANLPKFLNDFKDLVKCSLEEIKGAVKEINEKKAKLLQLTKACETKKFTLPKDCYVEWGNKIVETPEAKKRWNQDTKIIAKLNK